MHKILVAIDGSDAALRAVRFAGQQFSGLSDLQITLFHVLPQVPAEFWDDGHILSAEEMRDRKRVVNKWLANQKAGLAAIFRKATEVLEQSGVSPQQVKTKSVPEEVDAAGAILKEAEAGSYETLVVGRRGRGAVERFLLGSVAAKVVDHASGLAVLVVA